MYAATTRRAATSLVTALAALAGLAGLAACAGDAAPDAAGDSVAVPADSAPPAATGERSLSGGPTLVGVIEGLHTPESALHDPEQDVYFVTNIAGNPSTKANDGFVARVHPDSLDAPDRDFIRGGRPAITLHAPKGMAIVGDTLWIADIDALRGFNRRTGRPVGSVDLAPLGAVFVNDVARGPGDTLYVTDTGIRFDEVGNMTAPGPNRVYAVHGRTASVLLDGGLLAGPNGVAWDSAGGRLLIAPFSGPALIAWTPGGRAPNPRRLAAGPGGFDGLVVLPDRRLLVTSWADSSVHAVRNDTTMTPLLTGLEAPADLGFDSRRNRLLVPLFNQDRVVVYEMRP